MQLVVRSGKFQLGYKSVLKTLRSGKGRVSELSNFANYGYVWMNEKENEEELKEKKNNKKMMEWMEKSVLSR